MDYNSENCFYLDYMNKKSQQGIALIWMILAVALLITGVEIIAISLAKKQVQEEKTKVEASPTPLPSPVPTMSLSPDFLNWLSPEEEEKRQKAVDEIQKHIQDQIAEDFAQQEPLLKILPPKERAELESAIRETQEVLKSIEVFNFTPPSIGDITKGLDQINKQSQGQIQKNIEKQRQEFQQKYQQEIDIDKMMERLNQNPPAVPYGGEKKEPSLKEQEYYYRKYILKDPAFQ